MKPVSQGTMKKLRKLYNRQMEIGLTYEQMKGMNHMWQQYIKILLGQSIEWAKKDPSVPLLEKVKEGVS